jgi:hypothetical protein
LGEANKEQGAISVYIDTIKQKEVLFGGKYRLVRFNNIDNYSSMEILQEFDLHRKIKGKYLLFKDYTV